MERWSVEAICDVDPFEIRNRVGDECGGGWGCGCDGVLPGFLHVGVHDEEGVVGEVYGYLALDVGAGGRIASVWRYGLADAELAGDAKGKGADHWAWSEVG